MVDVAEFDVRPSSWNCPRVHYAPADCSRNDPEAICDSASDDLLVAAAGDVEQYGRCKVCEAIVNDAQDPRSKGGAREPADVLREAGFDEEADALGGGA